MATGYMQTENCGWAIGALSVLTLGAAAAAAAAVGAHNMATSNPDYEIIKQMLGSDIRVEYKK